MRFALLRSYAFLVNPADTRPAMHLSPKLLQFGMTAFLSSILQLPVPAADDLDVVRLVEGRCIHATVDRRTDGDCLWVTTSLDPGSLSQSIPWQRVREVEIAGRTYEGRVVRAAVETIRDALPSTTTEATSRHPLQLNSESLARQERSLQRQATVPIAWSRADSNPTVQAMTVSARLANWDQDTAVDGLLVELTPCDAYGNRVSCGGTVSFALQAWKTSDRDRRVGIRSERWIRNVQTGDFDSGAAVFRLPFRGVQPQQGSDWWSHGVLHVRLTAPGSGVVERTLTDLRLRPFEPMRDMQEQRTGRRSFPGENVQRQAWNQAGL